MLVQVYVINAKSPLFEVGIKCLCEDYTIRKPSWLAWLPETKLMVEYAGEYIECTVAHAMRRVGLEELKREQWHVIETFVSGKDAFVLLPTGYGKSFCYSLQTAIYDNLCLSDLASIVMCVSSLFALMMEQGVKFAVQEVAKTLSRTLYTLRVHQQHHCQVTLAHAFSAAPEKPCKP